MIGKITTGNQFKGVVNYVLGKSDARLIAAEGVLTDSTESITRSFILQSQLRPNVHKPVKHISLSYKKEDAPMLTDQKMVELAQEYMQVMKLTDTQYIIVRHNDREHPHCHVVLNRINNEGKTISDQNERLRNMTVCREIKEKYGLTFGTDKSQVNRERLRKPEQVQHEIYDALKTASHHAKNWGELRAELAKKGIRISFKYKGRTTEIQGIRFEKDGYSFKGSQIDRDYSYSKLNNKLTLNSKQTTAQSLPGEHTTRKEDIPFSGFSFHSPEAETQPDDALIREAERQQKKKKNKKGLRL